MKKKKAYAVTTYVFFFLFFLALCCFNDFSIEENRLFLVLICSFMIIWGLYLYSFLKRNIDLLEPITFITFMYSIFFIFEPMLDILENKTIWFGYRYTAIGPYATLIATIGYIAFYFGYYSNFRVKKFKKVIVKKENNRNKKYAFYGMSTWIVFYLLTVLFLMLSGKSIGYILSGGMSGSGDLLEVRNKLGSLAMFSYCLIASWGLYYIYGRNKLVKIITFILTVFAYYIRGYRFIVIIFILTPVVLYYLTNNKRPKIYQLISCTILLVLLIGSIAVARNNVRYGEKVDSSQITWDSSLEQVKDNFRIYNTYYALVETVPQKKNYLYGQQIFLFTATMFVPRIIWSNKPITSPGLLIIGDAISDYAVKAGTAYPIIGEFYLEFGVIGVLVFMYLYGKLNNYFSSIYIYSKNNIVKILEYTILLLANFQIIIRGYTPSNFYMVVFFILPIFIFNKFIFKKSEEKYEED